MLVVFRRSGERRYSVEAQRPGLADVVMHPAPGYDPLMPNARLNCYRLSFHIWHSACRERLARAVVFQTHARARHL